MIFFFSGFAGHHWICPFIIIYHLLKCTIVYNYGIYIKLYITLHIKKVYVYVTMKYNEL